jgi:hypothetical protein
MKTHHLGLARAPRTGRRPSSRTVAPARSCFETQQKMWHGRHDRATTHKHAHKHCKPDGRRQANLSTTVFAQHVACDVEAVLRHVHARHAPALHSAQSLKLQSRSKRRTSILVITTVEKEHEHFCDYHGRKGAFL